MRFNWHGFIAPMECALAAKPAEGAAWTYEVKLDGLPVIGVRAGRDAIVCSRTEC